MKIGFWNTTLCFIFLLQILLGFSFQIWKSPKCFRFQSRKFNLLKQDVELEETFKTPSCTELLLSVEHKNSGSIDASRLQLQNFIRSWSNEKLLNRGLGLQIHESATINSDSPVTIELPSRSEGKSAWMTVETTKTANNEEVLVISKFYSDDNDAETDVEFNEMITSDAYMGYKNIGKMLSKSLNDLKISESDQSETESDLMALQPCVESVEDALSAVRMASNQLAHQHQQTPQQQLQQQHQGDAASSNNPNQLPASKRSLRTATKAVQAGVRLEKFEGVGVGQQALEELNKMLKLSNEKSGFLSVLRAMNGSSISSEIATEETSPSGASPVICSTVDGINDSDLTPVRNVTPDNIPILFESGKNVSVQSWHSLLERPGALPATEDLRQPVAKFPIDLQAGGLSGGIDIFEGPPTYNDQSVVGGQHQQHHHPTSLAAALEKQAQLQSPPDPSTIESDRGKLLLLVQSLNSSVPELGDLILDGFKDLLLSENILFLLREANTTVSELSIRRHYSKIANKAEELTRELGMLVKQQSIFHLETIHDICEVAAEFQHKEEEFLERMKQLKPRFDTAFLSYLRYAINEEKTAIVKKGQNPAMVPTSYLQVLRIILQGVLAELESRFQQLLEPLMLVVRFEQSDVRTLLLERFVAITTPLDLPYMRDLAKNMIEGVLSMPLSSLPDPSLHEKMKQLKTDLDVVLSEAIIADRLKEYEASVKEQGQTIRVSQRSSLRPVMPLDDDIDEGLTKTTEQQGLLLQEAMDKRQQALVELETGISLQETV